MTETTVRQKASLWLATVFVLGAALGGVLGYAFAHRSYAATSVQLTADQRRAQKRAQLAQEVGLTADENRAAGRSDARSGAIRPRVVQRR